MTLRDFYTRFSYWVGFFGLPPKIKRGHRSVWESDGKGGWKLAERQGW